MDTACGRAGAGAAAVGAVVDKPVVVVGRLVAGAVAVAAVVEVVAVCNSRSVVSVGDFVTEPYCKKDCLPHWYCCWGNNYYRYVWLYVCS